MIRIREILDPDLKKKVIAKLAEWRGFPVNGVPEWYEFDDADYVDILLAIKDDENPNRDLHDPRE